MGGWVGGVGILVLMEKRRVRMDKEWGSVSFLAGRI